jgi:hypothetical protein
LATAALPNRRRWICGSRDCASREQREETQTHLHKVLLYPSKLV